MLVCVKNNLLVSIEKKYQDKLGDIFIDTSYRPEEYATLKGVVESVPMVVDGQPWRTSVEQIIKPGDEVWFRYDIICEYKKQETGQNPKYKNLVFYNGVELWKVDYNRVICVMRDGELLMPTQHVLLEPIADEEEKVIAGIVLLKKNATYQDRGKVIALPTTSIDVAKGDIVPLEKQYVQQYQLFGKLHYVIPSKRLLAKY